MEKNELPRGRAEEIMRRWVTDRPSAWRKLSYRKIAEQAGVSLSAAYHHVPRLIAELENSCPSKVRAERKRMATRELAKRRTSEKEIEQMRALHRQGYSANYIAGEMGKSRTTVRKYLEDSEATGERDQPSTPRGVPVVQEEGLDRSAVKGDSGVTWTIRSPYHDSKPPRISHEIVQSVWKLYFEYGLPVDDVAEELKISHSEMMEAIEEVKKLDPSAAERRGSGS